MKIPFNIPYLTGNEETLILDALRNQQHCGNHKYGKLCIDLFKEKYNFYSVFLTPSCTSAMEMGAILANLKEGDEVILPSYTFTSTVNSIVLRDAKPVFCEIDPDTMNIDSNLIENYITKNTRMILPIDYAGIPCDIQHIMNIAKKYNLIVMQDSAQSIHSYHDNSKPCGSIPQLAAFSFHETKNLSCGEGGALIVNDPNLIERAHFIQEKGTDRSLVLKGVKNKYSWVDIGSSFLLSDILAAMLLAQIRCVEEIVLKRSKITKSYYELFKDYEIKGVLKIPKPNPMTKVNHHAFFVVFDTEENQQKFLDLLREKKIYAYIGYLPLHSSKMGIKFNYKPEDLPLTESISKRIVRLPFYTELAENGLSYCIEKMKKVLKQIYGV